MTFKDKIIEFLNITISDDSMNALLSSVRKFIPNGDKLPDELCIMEDFPRLSGGVKIKKFGKGSLAELAGQDHNRERIRK